MPNKNTRGGPWTPQQISAVWAKGRIVPGVNPDQTRKDAGGAWIELLNYGQTNENGSGWEIDHIKPVAKGGGRRTRKSSTITMGKQSRQRRQLAQLVIR